jgi:hypothetical protein
VRKKKSLALAGTFSRIAGSGSMRAISIAPIIVEKIEKKACSLSTDRRPGMKRSTSFVFQVGNAWPIVGCARSSHDATTAAV